MHIFRRSFLFFKLCYIFSIFPLIFVLFSMSKAVQQFVWKNIYVFCGFFYMWITYFQHDFFRQNHDFFSTFTRGFRFIFTEQNKKPKYVAFYVKTSLLIMTLMFIAQLFYFVNIFHLYLYISIEKTWISLFFRKKFLYKSKTSFNKYISSSSLFYFEAL